MQGIIAQRHTIILLQASAMHKDTQLMPSGVTLVRYAREATARDYSWHVDEGVERPEFYCGRIPTSTQYIGLGRNEVA